MRRLSWYCWLWLGLVCVLAHLVVLLILAMRPSEDAGDQGIDDMVSLILIAILALPLVGLLFLGPKGRDPRGLILGAGLYGIWAVVAYFVPVLHGGYTAMFRVVDQEGHPVPGVRVDFLQQRSLAPGGPITFLSREDVAAHGRTDANGVVSVEANLFTALHGSVNAIPKSVTSENSSYWWADFQVSFEGPLTFEQSAFPSDQNSSDLGLASSNAIPVSWPGSSSLTVLLPTSDYSVHH